VSGFWKTSSCKHKNSWSWNSHDATA
jgi:hypothetical protein